MAGTAELIRNRSFRSPAPRPKRFAQPISKRDSSATLDAVLCAFLITVGLVGGAVGLVPQHLLVRIPLVHVALAFFIPFSALFALTDLKSKTITKAVGKGFLLVLLVGVVGLILSAVATALTHGAL